jgi:hypothetical protein
MARFHRQPPAVLGTITRSLTGRMFANPQRAMVGDCSTAPILPAGLPHAAIFDDGLRFERGNTAFQVFEPLDQQLRKNLFQRTFEQFRHVL